MLLKHNHQPGCKQGTGGTTDRGRGDTGLGWVVLAGLWRWWDKDIFWAVIGARFRRWAGVLLGSVYAGWVGCYRVMYVGVGLPVIGWVSCLIRTEEGRLARYYLINGM